MDVGSMACMRLYMTVIAVTICTQAVAGVGRLDGVELQPPRHPTLHVNELEQAIVCRSCLNDFLHVNRVYS